jgi:protease-4
MIDVPEYAKVPMRQKAGRDRIAIVYADGDILMGKGLDDITAWNMANTLRSVRLNKNIKAVVLRVNSPGGSSQASEIIARELMLLKQEKTLVVSMGNYAASGGYWIALPADKIIANPTSLTGSIGVFSIIPNVKKGLNNHLGITVDVAKSNESADYPSIMRPLTTREQEAMQEMVEFIYAEFVGKVSAARELSTTRVDEIGQGRVWSGIDAVRLGLVDELGGITEAIEAAAVLAGIDEYRVLELPSMRTPFEQMLESLRNGSISIKAELPEQAKTMESFLKEVDRPGVYARLPHDVKVY